MAIAKSYSAQLNGLHVEIVTIEVDISNGLHSFSIVGLGDRSIEEAKDRISAGIKNSDLVSPKQKNQKITISLAPAHIRKEGPSFDLGMAMAYLLASEEVHYEPKNIIFIGELSLDGRVCRVGGLLPILCGIKAHGFDQIFIPAENSEEASLIKDLDIYPVSTLREVLEHFLGNSKISTLKYKSIVQNNSNLEKDMSIVRGNHTAKRGLEVAAAGAHNVALFGPPGTGKTLLAQCFQSILPDLDHNESIEVTGIYSISNITNNGLIKRPPFRSPHHTASYPSIVGGGSIPKPGEITLAHRGILFLDEFPEFDKSVIEALRQPLEEQKITITRARGAVTFPAQCIFIASMNPCLCGKNPSSSCKCTQNEIEKYKKRISGPISDRIDIWLSVDKIDYHELGNKISKEESSTSIRNRVLSARNIGKKRFQKFKINKNYNSEIDSNDIDMIIGLTDSARALAIDVSKKLSLSGRAFHRILKVGRTIADLNSREDVIEEDILEAIQYRTKIIG